MRMIWALSMFLVLGSALWAGPRDAVFDSIDGGTLRLSDWPGQPVLVVNTASQCGFTGQYADLQRLHDQYGPRGLVVLAVPSDDFRQELDSAAAVKEFCDVNFGLTLPMSDITSVRGADAHPFYAEVRRASGFVPGWNFNKVLIGPDGAVLGTWGAATKPGAGRIRKAFEPYLRP